MGTLAVDLKCGATRPAEHDVQEAERSLADEAKRRGVTLANRRERIEGGVFSLEYDSQ